MKMWTPVRSKPPIVQREFRGVNKLDPFSIFDTQATDAKNISSEKYPGLSVRPGYAVIGTPFTEKINGLGVWKDTELHAISAGGWWKWTGNAWSLLNNTVNTSQDCAFCNFKGNLAAINIIMANGVDPVRAYDGAAVSSLATAPVGRYIEQYADRLWCAVENDLKYSAYRMANDWTTVNGDDADSGYITVETNDGETINAVKSGLTNLTIFKPSSIHKLFGYSASDYTRQVVTRNVGALNNKCVDTVEGIMYILDDGGLYQYAGGTIPDKSFSQAIQPYVDAMNKSAAALTASVGSLGKKLYVSIPLNGSVPDTILEYDTQFKIWSVWKDYSALNFARMGTDLYVGQNDGPVRKIGGTTDNGTPVSWHWVSKPFGSGSLAQRIRWLRMWIIANVPAGSTLNVYLSKKDSGDDDWTLAQSVSAHSTLESTRIIIPTNVVANANWIRVKFSGTGPCEIKELARDEQQMPIV